MAVRHHRTPKHPKRIAKAGVAVAAAMVLCFGTLFGTVPAASWAADAPSSEATVEATSSPGAESGEASASRRQNPAANQGGKAAPAAVESPAMPKAEDGMKSTAPAAAPKTIKAESPDAPDSGAETTRKSAVGEPSSTALGKVSAKGDAKNGGTASNLPVKDGAGTKTKIDSTRKSTKAADTPTKSPEVGEPDENSEATESADAAADDDDEENGDTPEDSEDEGTVHISGTVQAPTYLPWAITIRVEAAEEDSNVGETIATFTLAPGKTGSWEADVEENIERIFYYSDSADSGLVTSKLLNVDGSLDLDLRQAGIVTGSYTTADGTARTGVETTLSSDSRGSAYASSNTDGRFQFVADPGGYFFMRDGFGESISVEAGKVQEFDAAPTEPVTVKLVDPDGRPFVPLPGEEVGLRMWDDDGTSQSREVSGALSSADFQVPAGTYRIKVGLSGDEGGISRFYPGVSTYAAAETVDIVAGGGPNVLSMTVDRGHTVKAIFVDADDEPVALPADSAASVFVWQDGALLSSLNPSDGDTTFGINYLDPGTYEVEVRLDIKGFDVEQTETVVVVAGETARELRIVVSAGQTLRGTLVDAKSQATTVGGEESWLLTLESLNGEVQREAYIGINESDFSIEYVPAGEYTLRLENQRVGGEELTYYPGVPDAAQAETLTVRKGEDLSGLQFLVDLRSTITGIVTDAGGEPVAGAAVVLYPAQSPDGSDALLRSTSSDAQGRYSFSVVDIGNYAVRAGGGDTYYLDAWYSVRSDGTATPIVIAEEGQEVAADIKLSESGGKFEVEWPGDLDKLCQDNWRSSFEGEEGAHLTHKREGLVPEGQYGHSLECAGETYWWDGGASQEASTPVSIVAGETTVIEFAAWDKTEGTITGAVTVDGDTADGRIDLYKVDTTEDGGEWTWTSGTSATDGRYSIDVPAAGEYVVSFEPNKAGYEIGWHGSGHSLETVVPLKHDGNQSLAVDFALKYDVTLDVRAVDSATNEPIEADTHFTLGTGNANRSISLDGTTASFHLLAGRTVSVTAQTDGYLTKTAEFELDGEPTQAHDIELDKGAKLEVTVLSDNNELPLRSVYVTGQAVGGENWKQETSYTGDGGKATFLLAPGTYYVCVPEAGLYVGQCFDNQAPGAGTGVVVGPDGAQKTIRLTLGGQFKGTILNSDGAPLEDVTVGLAREAAAPSPMGSMFRTLGNLIGINATTGSGELLGVATTTNERGEYVLPPVDPGSYALYAYRADLGTTWYPAGDTLTDASWLSIDRGQTRTVPLTMAAPSDGIIRSPEQSLSDEFAVTVHPQAEVTVIEGETATLKAWASGLPVPTVQWQRSTDAGATWKDIDGATTEKYILEAKPGDHGSLYRAVFSQNNVQLASDASEIMVKAPTTAPEPLKTVSVSGITDQRAVIAWEAADDGGAPIQSYTVRVYQDGKLIRILNPGVVSEAVIGGLSADTAYSVTLTATNATGDSEASDAIEFSTTTPATEPTDPSVEPTEPTVEPTDPSVEPTEPTVEPTDPSVEPTEPTTEPSPFVPVEADLPEGQAGIGISVPDSAVAGSTIDLKVSRGTKPADKILVYAFSDPVRLAETEITDEGSARIALPSTLIGKHRIAAYLEDGTLIGWDVITITAVDTTPGTSGEPTGEASESPVVPTESGSVEPSISGSTDPSESEGTSSSDRDSTDPSESEPSDSSGSPSSSHDVAPAGGTDDSLANTGASMMLPAGATALVLLLVGGILYRRSRPERLH